MTTAPAFIRVVRRDVYCAIEHEHRDLAVAEAVAAGRFAYFGTQLELGLEPDWTRALLPADEEWRIAWTKFYDGLDLAHAFAETGNPAFLDAWERLVASWIRLVPVGWDSSDVAARRVQNWLYAWQRFASAPAFRGLSPGLDEELARSVAEQAAFVRANLSPARNHRTFELYTLLLVALALPQVDPGGDLLADAIDGLHENLLEDVLPDGVHCEASSHYHLLALRSFLGARENARRFGLRFPDGFDRHLERACEFALHCHRPDGQIPALSDADSGSYARAARARGRAARTARLPLRRDGRFRGKATPPALHELPGRRLFLPAQRLGRPGAPVPGRTLPRLRLRPARRRRPRPLRPAQHRGLGRRAAAPRRPRTLHVRRGVAQLAPLVQGDGGPQHRLRRPARPDALPAAEAGGPVAEGRFLGRMSATGLDVLHGEARSPCYDAVHARRIVFVGDEYWLVEDRLSAPTPHRYDLRFHLAPEAWNETEIVHDSARAVVRAPGLALVCSRASAPVLEEGWYAPEYGHKLPGPGRQHRRGERPERGLPHPRGAARGRTAHARASPSGRAGDPIVVEVATPERRDVVAWNRSERLVAAHVARRRAIVVPGVRGRRGGGVSPALDRGPGRTATRPAPRRERRWPNESRRVFGADVDECRRVRVKYRIGARLRLVHRLRVGASTLDVAASTFPTIERSEQAYADARERAVAAGITPPVAHDRELTTVFWAFPNDRKLAHLPALAAPDPGLAALDGAWSHSSLAAYAPEKAATVRCLDEDGRTVAYAKTLAGEEGERTAGVHTALAEALPADDPHLRLPRPIAYSPEYSTLVVEAVAGIPLQAPQIGDLPSRYRRLGRGLARFHELPPPDQVRFRRADPDRVAAAAELIASVRADVARARPPPRPSPFTPARARRRLRLPTRRRQLQERAARERASRPDRPRPGWVWAGRRRARQRARIVALRGRRRPAAAGGRSGPMHGAAGGLRRAPRAARRRGPADTHVCRSARGAVPAGRDARSAGRAAPPANAARRGPGGARVSPSRQRTHATDRSCRSCPRARSSAPPSGRPARAGKSPCRRLGSDCSSASNRMPSRTRPSSSPLPARRRCSCASARARGVRSRSRGSRRIRACRRSSRPWAAAAARLSSATTPAAVARSAWSTGGARASPRSTGTGAANASMPTGSRCGAPSSAVSWAFGSRGPAASTRPCGPSGRKASAECPSRSGSAPPRARRWRGASVARPGRCPALPSVRVPGTTVAASSPARRRSARSWSAGCPSSAGRRGDSSSCSRTAHAACGAPRPRPVHGALHASQWLENGHGLVLLDYDSLALGDPELDAATFVAGLDVENRERVQVDRLNTAFLQGYEETAGPLDPQLLAAYRAQRRLEKALRVARAVRPDGDRKAGRRLRRALECVEGDS